MLARVTRIARTIALVALPLAVMACDKKPAAQTDLDDLDRQLTGPSEQRDPALTAALRDQIMVDPGLARAANANAVRPPPAPDTGAVPIDDVGARGDGVDPASLKAAPPAGRECPDCRKAAGALTLGGLAARQGNRSIADCAAGLTYSATWANRLPADVPLYPDARVSEAAGTPGCGLRVVSFSSTAPVDRVIDWYYTRTNQAGYAADHRSRGGEHRLGGTRGDAAYMLYVTPHAGGGSDVDLVSNAGR